MTDDTQSAVLAKAKAIVKQFYPEMPDNYEGRRVQIAIAALRQTTQSDALADELATIIKKSKIPPDDMQLITHPLSNGKRYIIQTETTYSRALQSVL